MRTCLLAAVVLLLSVNANAAQDEPPFSGQMLRSWCSEYEATEMRTPNGSYCVGFVGGFSVGWRLAANHLKAPLPQRYFCVPFEVSPDQEVRVLMKYIREHPERLHESAFLLMGAAFLEAFPCPAK